MFTYYQVKVILSWFGIDTKDAPLSTLNCTNPYKRVFTRFSERSFFNGNKSYLTWDISPTYNSVITIFWQPQGTKHQICSILTDNNYRPILLFMSTFFFVFLTLGLAFLFIFVQKTFSKATFVDSLLLYLYLTNFILTFIVLWYIYWHFVVHKINNLCGFKPVKPSRANAVLHPSIIFYVSIVLYNLATLYIWYLHLYGIYYMYLMLIISPF